MNEQENLKEVVRYWIEKAGEALEAAQDEMAAGRLSFSVNRIYYACFYSVGTVLLQKRLRFKKHSGVRAAFHQHLVKPGLVSREQGQLYDELFEARQRGDYMELVYFKNEQVEDWLHRARHFVESVSLLIRESS